MRRPNDQPYSMDDLVAHEKSNLRLVAVLFVGAILLLVSGKLTNLPLPTPPGSPAATPGEDGPPGSEAPDGERDEGAAPIDSATDSPPSGDPR
jgi:hypothetical protein